MPRRSTGENPPAVARLPVTDSPAATSDGGGEVDGWRVPSEPAGSRGSDSPMLPPVSALSPGNENAASPLEPSEVNAPLLASTGGAAPMSAASPGAGSDRTGENVSAIGSVREVSSPGAGVIAAVANPMVRVRVPLYWPSAGIEPESNGIVTSRAGATTRFGYVCGATNRTEIPDALSTLSSVGVSGTGTGDPPLPKPSGGSPKDWPLTATPSICSCVEGVTFPLASRVWVATLVTAPIVNGPTVRPSARVTAVATTVPPDGTISAFEVARPALMPPVAWRP